MSNHKPLIRPDASYGSVADEIGNVVLTDRFKPGWIVGVCIGFALLQVLNISISWLLARGIGVWGLNIPVGWGFDITNFVWWIGIGHAGTFISAILLLCNQKWRTSVNRFSEAMTIFAVMCAGLFPVLHLGRIWKAYWLFPYPNQMALWPQFRSPLLWDVFAVSTYASVSVVFWLIGLIPDFATLRDRAQNIWVKRLFGFASLGWRGSASHWHRYQTAYLLLAGLSAPLVVSVHTTVSFDFAVSILPGWHTTIFPPYFVAGAIYSGFAMVLTLAIPFRAYYQQKNLITERHLDYMARVMLATGLIVAYGYIVEAFTSWYSGNVYELGLFATRLKGPYAPIYYALWLCNIILPQLLWFKKYRSNTIFLFIISLVINTGMWFERFVIIVLSLHRDFIPSSWGMYYPTKWEIGLFLGSMGLFVTLFFLFIRFLPAISIFETIELLAEEKGDLKHD